MPYQGDGELVPETAITRAEDDLLRLQAVAAEVAALARTVKTPASIGVFGPWGSGKSSLAHLVREALHPHRARVKFVYFNAWKFSETPLRRHFLIETGRQLDLDVGPSLYRKRRRSTLHLEKRTLGLLALIASGALGSAVALIALSTLLLWLTDTTKSIVSLLTTAIGTNAGPILISASLIAPVLTLLSNVLRADVDESEPSSAEQFDQVFNRIIGRHVGDGRRVAIFIDELDRAPAAQMHVMLETLRTFLDHEGCVVIAAADQVVLEEAISKLEVSGPSGSNPYYTAGSAYLDKIFQWQFALPAYQRTTLTRFALDLVQGRPGVWQGPVLPEELVSLLVPSHVSSPRRVKILLNNFVLAARVATGRLGTSLTPDQLQRVAKLVCLRTEFPLFYRDVERHTNLIDLTTAIVAGDSARVSDFNVNPELMLLAQAYADGKSPVDIRLGKASPDTEAEAGRELREYLRRTRSVLAAETSLVFLEPLGADLGLDPAVADTLAEAARNGNVEKAVQAVGSADSGNRAAHVRLLARIVDDSVGLETENAAKVLLRTAAGHRDDISQADVRGMLPSIDRMDVWSRLGPDDVESLVQVLGLLEDAERTSREQTILARLEEGDDWAVALYGSYASLSQSSQISLQQLLVSHVRSRSDPAAATLSVIADTIRGPRS